MDTNDHNHRIILKRIARRVMLERGLLPDFSHADLVELGRIQRSVSKESDIPVGIDTNTIRDKRNLLWASIDNDDSRDLDQLTVAEEMPSGKVLIMVAIADVDSTVKDGSAIDHHARHNTTSVYTAAEIFPMLPVELSTDITSLNLNEDRLSIVVEMTVRTDGSLEDSHIYRAWVRNHAKLAYNSVAAWLERSQSSTENNGRIPEAISAVQGLAENLQLQDRVAQSMKNLRHLHGALSLETIESKPIFDGDQISALEFDETNRAREIIEDFMIAANGVTARFLSAKGFSSIRRVVRTPRRWERIVEIAREHNFKLPTNPDSKALDEFLIKQKAEDPIRFPDLSLAVIKLMGSGEYIAEPPDGNIPGHFGLAVKDYAHSTAPNRRYPDLLTQRLVKAAVDGKPAPYNNDELDILAVHCTEVEDVVNKVERQVGKSAAALLLESRIGEQFDSVVTGASEKGTWVRLLSIPVEGMLVEGAEGMDVGHQLRVELVSVDVERGFIDFRKIKPFKH